MPTRPVPKEMLKKMFLKMLWEHRPGGKHASSSGSVKGILDSTLPFEFQLPNIDPHRLYTQWFLTPEEYKSALEGINELQREGFIQDDPTGSSSGFKYLSTKGEIEAKKPFDQISVSSVDISLLLARADLLGLVRDDYNNGRFDVAIRNALHHLEDAVRTKASQPAGVTGHTLMATAFAQGRGVLTHPDAQTSDEQQGVFYLFAGANGWFRNQIMHRPVGYSDPIQVAQILGFVNLLLDMLDKCV